MKKWIINILENITEYLTSKNSKGKLIQVFYVHYDAKQDLWKASFGVKPIQGEEFYENKSLDDVLKLAFNGGATKIQFIEW